MRVDAKEYVPTSSTVVPKLLEAIQIEKRLTEVNLVKHPLDSLTRLFTLSDKQIRRLFKDLLPQNLNCTPVEYLANSLKNVVHTPTSDIINKFNLMEVKPTKVCFIYYKEVAKVLENLKKCLTQGEFLFVVYHVDHIDQVDLRFWSQKTNFKSFKASSHRAIEKQIDHDLKWFSLVKNLKIHFCADISRLVAGFNPNEVKFFNPIVNPIAFHLDFLYKHNVMRETFCAIKNKKFNHVDKFLIYLGLFSPEEDVLLELLSYFTKEELKIYFKQVSNLTAAECIIGYVKLWPNSAETFARKNNVKTKEVVDFLYGHPNQKIQTLIEASLKA